MRKPTVRPQRGVPAAPPLRQIPQCCYSYRWWLAPIARRSRARYRAGVSSSTGLNGQSTLREVELETGRVLKQVALAPAFFAEGVAVMGAQAFQVTWQNRKGFVYDADTFRLQKEFTYDGEGWGLTTDGTALILSDGTHRIRFLDPADLPSADD
jgi:glutamine cyclotransferase